MLPFRLASELKHDGYWQLREYNFPRHKVKEIKDELEKRNYPIPNSFARPQALENLYRSDRGLLSYYGMTAGQLRKIIKARKIECNERLGDRRRLLIRMLQAEDDDPKFQRFLNLPPELRNRVYEFYYADLTQPIYAPSQPPLTRTCRLLRQETLGMLYSTSTFLLSFPRTLGTLQIPNQLGLFIYGTSSLNISAIRHLTIRVAPSHKTLDRGFIPEQEAELTLNVEFAAEGLDHAVKYHFQLENSPVKNQRAKRAAGRAREIVRAIVARQGKNRLQKDDIFDLRRAVEVGLNL